MAYCAKCGSELTAGANNCPNCGAAVGSTIQATPNYDHTAEFSAEEISDGKIWALSAYLLSIFGIIIALLAVKDNKFVAFHIRNSLKLTLVVIIATIVCIIPILGWIAYAIFALVITIIEIIAIVNVCCGKAVESPIVRSLGFLK